MKAKDNFTEWLREKVLQNPQEPPAGAWQEISDALDVEDSWGEIGEELEVNAVWERIGSGLDRLSSMDRFEKISHALTAAAFILLFSAFFLSSSQDIRNADNPAGNDYSETQELSESRNIAEINSSPTAGLEKEAAGSLTEENKKDKNSTKFQTEIKSGTGIIIKTAKSEKPSVTAFRSGFTSGVLAGKDKTDKNSRTGYLKENGEILRGKPLKAVTETGEINFMPLYLPVKTNLSEAPEKKEIYPATFAGAGTAIKSGWLLNNKTFHAMERSSLVSASPGVYTDFWLLYGTRLNSRWFLQADAYLKEVAGQKYQEYRNGNFGKVEDRLEYQSLGISLSRLMGQRGYGRFPTYSRILAGVYGGRLLSAEEINQEERVAKTSNYQKTHLGLLAGYEYDTFLNSSFIFTYGFRSRLDLLNIYAGSENMPKVFQKTRAVSLDFTISFKYVLKK